MIAPCYIIYCFGQYWALLSTLYYFWDKSINRRPSPDLLFYAYFSVSRKRNIRRSQNGTKSTREVIFGTKATRWTWTPRQGRKEELTRVGARPLPRGAPVAPLTCFFCLYNSLYPKTSRTHNRSGVPPPKASVATKNQSRPVLAPCRRGQSLSGGHLHHPGALHDEEGVVLPRG